MSMTNKQKRELIETLTADIAVRVQQLLTVLFTTDEITTDLTVVSETSVAGNGGGRVATPIKQPPLKARKPGKEYKAPVMPKKNDTIIFQKKKWTVTSIDPDYPTNFNARIQGQMGRPSTFAWIKADAAAPAATTSAAPVGVPTG
jgi:hypothetical protein